MNLYQNARKPSNQSGRSLTTGMLPQKVIKITESTVQTVYATGYSPVQNLRDGFEEQKVLLSRISHELDEYFSLRTLSRLD